MTLAYCADRRMRSAAPGAAGFRRSTPTAGGLVFVGDAGGNFYALDALSGEKLWSRKIGGGRHRLGAADLRPGPIVKAPLPECDLRHIVLW